MADDSPIKFRDPTGLIDALKDFSFEDKTWDQFKTEFLNPLRKAINRGKENVTLGSKVFEVESVKRQLHGFVKDAFPELFQIWIGKAGITLEPAQLAEVQKLEELIAPGFEDSKTSTPIEEWIKRIDPLMIPKAAVVAGAIDPRRERLSDWLEKSGILRRLKENYPKLKEILGGFDKGVDLEITSQLREALNALPEPEKKAKEALFKKEKDQQQEPLDKTLEKILEEQWTQIWQSDSRARLINEVLKTAKEQGELQAATVEALLAFPDLNADPFAAELEADTFFQVDYFPRLEKQLEELKKQFADESKKAQTAFEAALQAILTPPAAPLPEGGGGAEQPTEEVAKAGDKSELVVGAKSRLKPLFAQLAGIPDFTTRNDALQELADAAKNLDIVYERAQLYNIGDLEAVIDLDLDSREENAAISYDQLGNFVDRLVTSVAETAKRFLPTEEAARAAPTPAVTPPGALVTPVPTGPELTEPEARKTISELVHVQQTMVSLGLEELRAALLKQKISPKEIDEIIARNRETVAQQIWLEFLQRGGLARDLKFSDMATIWTEVVQKNLDRISVEKQVAPSKISREARDEFLQTMSSAGYSIAEIEGLFENLELKTFEQLALVAQKANLLTQEQRRNTIKEILTGKQFLETDAGLAADAFSSGDRNKIITYLLKNEFPKLSANDQRVFAQLNGKEGLNASELQELARIFRLMVKNYPAETDFLFTASELAEIHTLLARQQKATQILQDKINQARQTAGGKIFANSFVSPGGASLNVAKVEQVTEQEATVHTRETFLMEAVISFAFEKNPNANIALVMQQFYADPRQTLAMLADGMVAGYDDAGHPVPGGANLSPQQQAQMAQMQGQNYGNFAKQQQKAADSKVAQQRAALLMALIASGGNPAMLLKKFLTDAQAREALIAEARRLMPYLIGGGALLMAPTVLFWLKVLEAARAIADAAAAAYNFAAGAANNLSNFFGGVVNGITGGASGAITGGSTAAAIGKEVGANAATTGKIATSQIVPAATNTANSTLLASFDATNSFLTGTVSAAAPTAVVFGAVFGPMAFAVFMTFIVFSVIGGSLNDLPLGAIGEGAGGPKRSFCFEGNDRIAKTAIEISNGLEQRWWKYYNYHPNWPELFDFELYNSYTPKTGESILGYAEPDYFVALKKRGRERNGADLFWCTWLVVKTYQENSLPVSTNLSVHGMRGEWPTKVNEVIKNENLDAEEIPLGSAVFIGVENPESGDDHVAIACNIDLNSDGTGTFTTCDSNNFRTQVNYNIRDGEVLRTQMSGDITIDYFGLPPKELGGACSSGASPSPSPGGAAAPEVLL